RRFRRDRPRRNHGALDPHGAAAARERRFDVPMPRDARALRVARALLDDCSIDHDLDRWADEAGASRRTLARIFRAETGLGFAEWRARLRAVDGLARLAD